MNVNEVYKQLTDVDIEEQKQIWDERGKGYYGEYIVFCELYKNIIGTCKLLMNLEIPASETKKTEIDLLMIHETGLYVFEVKHYKGTIYGKDTDKTWTQYFRTTQNKVFNNPINQNNYHIEALKKIFPDLPIRSVIVFTSGDCDLKVTNENPLVDVCTIYRMNSVLSHRFLRQEKIIGTDEIDNIFSELSVFSKMQVPVELNGEEKSFFSWIQPSIDLLTQKKEELEKEKNKLNIAKQNIKKEKQKGWLFFSVITILCIIISCIFVLDTKEAYNLKIQENNKELSEFKQNFLHVDEINNKYIDELSSYIDVSEVKISKLTDDAVSFSANLTMLNDIYYVKIQEDAKYIVMTKSGTVYEYNLFGEHLSYHEWSNTLGKYYRMSADLQNYQFYGITDPKDISYIKLVNIELSKTEANRPIIKNNLELELYSEQ